MPAGEIDDEGNARLIARHTQDIVCLHSADRAIQFVTPSVQRLLGYEPAEWIGRHHAAFIHSEDLDRFAAEFADVLAHADPEHAIRCRFRHRDGTHIWMETWLQPTAEEPGCPAQLISITRNCSERKRVEETLRRGEQLFEGIAEANRLLLTARMVMESLPSVLRVLGEAVEADRVVFFEINAAAATPVGTLRAEWVRQPETSLFGHAEFAEVAISQPGSAGSNDPDRVSKGLQTSLAKHGLANLLQFPVMVRDTCWGAVGFERTGAGDAWSPVVRTALGIVALNIGQAIGREHALAALAESQRRYESLLAGLSEAIFQIDLEARWRFLSPTWEPLTGFRVDESIGRRFATFLAADQATAALESFGNLVSGRHDRIEVELRFVHRLGGEIWLRVAAQPQLDEVGRVIGVSGTLVDVNQRRLAQEAMRASERKFAAIFEGSTDALFLFDNSTNLIVECNPRAVEMFECSGPGQLIGRTGASLHRPLSAEEIAEGVARLDRGEVWTREQQCVTQRGRTFWGLIAVVRMAPESLGTTLVRVTDISDLKTSEERLRASLGEKEVLLKEVYHRVKNNLQIISALLRMQSRRVKDRVAVEALENSISRVMAMAMVHEKLYQAQSLVSIDFLSFAQSLVGFLNQLTIGNQPGVGITVEGEPIALTIDQAIPLGLILNELVTNSLKYAFPDGRPGRVSIEIGASTSGSARVLVADDGIGLPGNVKLEEASGLGFRIVRMLVEQLHGEMEIESRKGLRVLVRVPPLARRGSEPASS